MAPPSLRRAQMGVASRKDARPSRNDLLSAERSAGLERLPCDAKHFNTPNLQFSLVVIIPTCGPRGHAPPVLEQVRVLLQLRRDLPAAAS